MATQIVCVIRIANFLLLPGVEAAEVLARLQGIQPAVQQLARRDLLASEIVDHEDAVIGPQLVGRNVSSSAGKKMKRCG